MKLICKGAEANLYLDFWFGFKVVKKIRISKPYRIPELDEYLRSYRTFNEARLLSSARRVGVSTPIVLDVNPSSYTLTMEYIEGVLLRDYMLKADEKILKKHFIKVGEMIGVLHSNGIYHGDLTTSNMFIVDDNVYLIDFGLGGFSREVEAFGVDLHLMRRTLESTHHDLAEQCFSYVVEGYSSSFEDWRRVLKKVEEIRRRGRYVEERRLRK
ncbi:MAG: Kae1-associated serine/threonine protein kinase [Candidatus Verstraetearchaeota archaeon]|nr:Kae1-associated serine/threonine protein kinase [Candidatus Verstraetearchaeota archaeon]